MTTKIRLPLPIARKEENINGLRGYNIAIFRYEIVAMDRSLRKLHEKLERLIPEGERCEIEYIEEGAHIY